jgi:hypothetical protein
MFHLSLDAFFPKSIYQILQLKSAFLPSCHVFNPRVYGISYENFVTDAEKMASCEIEMVKKFGYDWAFSRCTVPWHSNLWASKRVPN